VHLRYCDTTSCESLQIKKRGAPPGGGGEVFFKCPMVQQLKPILLIDEGKVKRVRGVASVPLCSALLCSAAIQTHLTACRYTTRCSPQHANRMVDTARGVLNNLLPDVYIYTDHYKGKESGL